MQVFKNSRTALATAMTSAALVGAGSVAAVALALDDDAKTLGEIQAAPESLGPDQKNAWP